MAEKGLVDDEDMLIVLVRLVRCVAAALVVVLVLLLVPRCLFTLVDMHSAAVGSLLGT